MSQIRLNRSPELDKVLTYLQSRYRLLSEAEIIKTVLSERYNDEIQAAIAREKQVKSLYQDLKIEGRKLGDKLLQKKGLQRKNVNEKQFYNLLNA